MSGVDSRIVTMTFDNKQFESAAATTMGTVEKLKSTMNFAEAQKGFGGLQSAADKFNLNHMNGAVNTVSASFSAMSVVAITALSTITHKAMETGTAMVKSLTLDPILQGFSEYEQKMGSIQTIMAGSGESLDVVNQKLQELNHYADKTIYSFSDMTTNISKFTNAGIDLDTSVAAIQGIANAAALAGANSEEASRAMYNFAQSLSSGVVRLQDWKSIELANMATVSFKEELLASAAAAGTLTKGVDGMYTTLEGTPVSAIKGFNESLADQWLTSEALIDTLTRYSDTTTDIGAAATKAATQVKTFSHLMDTLRESAASGWAETWEIVFGNFEEGTALWTKMNEEIGGLISAAAEARNLKLFDWKEAGGRTALVEAFGNAFEALVTIFERVSAAWKTVFPPKTGQQLAEMSKAFRDFTASLIMSEETAQNFQDTLEGVFAVFGIIWEIISGVVGVIFDLIGATTGAAGGFLEITGTIGNFLVALEKAISEGELFAGIFEFIGAVLVIPIELIGNLASLIGTLFSGFDFGAADAATSSLQETTGILGGLTAALEGMANWLDTIFGNLAEFLGPAAEQIGSMFSDLWDAILEGISGGGIDTVMNAMQTGFLGMLAMGIRNLIASFTSVGPGGFIAGLQDALEGLTGVLTSMQNNIRADTLGKIAIAIGILALALAVLAGIDPAKLAAATAGITAMFIELMAALKVMEIITRAKSIWKMPIIASSLILLATALLVLSAAVRSMANLNWGELLRGLVGIAGAIAILLIALKPLSKAKGFTKAAFAITILSTALLILAQAVQSMGSLSWGELARGLAGIAGGFVVLSIGLRLLPKNLLWIAIELGAISTAISILAGAVKLFASMSWDEIARGFAGMAVGLVMLSAGMRLMPHNIERVAIGLMLVGGAMNLVAIAIRQMGRLSWEEIARGLVGVAGALGILAVGLRLMQGTLAGSAALMVASLALGFLIPPLIALGLLPWQVILTALVALAGVFTVIGVAGLLLGPIVPLILALAGAIALLGAGLLAAGAGVLAFSTALAVLVGLGSAAALVMKEMLDAIIGSIPGAMTAFAEGIVAFAGAIALGGPQFVAAMTTILNSMLQAIIDTMPKFREAMTEIVKTLIEVMVEHIPDLAAAGFDMLMAILEEIRDNAYRMVSVGLQILTEFLNGIADNINDVVDAAFDVVIAFIEALADAIDENMDEIIAAAEELGKAVIRGIAKGLMSDLTPIGRAVSRITSAIKGQAEDELQVASPSKIFEAIGRFLVEGLAQGISSGDRMVEDSTRRLSQSTIDAMRAILTRLNDSMEAEIDLRPTITPVLDLSAFHKNAGELGHALAPTSVAANVSYGQAAGISSAYRSGAGSSPETAGAAGASVIRFEQNNYSPKALSSVEIYRQTKNQLSLAKEALIA